MKRAILVMLCCACGGVSAQSPVQRQALKQLQDSLRTSRDTLSLSKLEQSAIDEAKRQRSDPQLHLRLGLIAIRFAELGDKKHLDYATSEFEWALELRPGWPWPNYGLGLVYQVAPDRAVGYAGGLFTKLGIDGMSKAANDYAKSMEKDSSFTEAVLGLTQVALDKRIDPPDSLALSSLRVAAPRYQTPELYMALGKLERQSGSHDSALVAFAHLRDTLGITPRVLLEVARTVPLVRDSLVRALKLPPGDSAYYLGAASDDSDIVKMYRDDLGPILEDSDLVAFDSKRGADRVEWLRTFWGERDALELREPGQRLGEHFRRWSFVMANFRLMPYRRRYEIEVEPYRNGDREIDDRGRVYLRHGLPVNRQSWARIDAQYPEPHPGMVNANALNFIGPDGRISSQKPFAFYRPPDNSLGYGNETWLYQQPDGDLILHFAAHQDPSDYHLQSTVFSLNNVFEDYWVHGSKIPGALVHGPVGDPSKVSSETIRGKHDNTVATTTDSWSRTYEHILGGRPAWFAAGVYGGLPVLHLIYALNASSLVEQPWKLIPLKVRAAFLDEGGRVRATLDTVEMVERPVQGTTLYALQAQLPVPPGATRVRLSVEVTPDLGALHRTDTLRLPIVDGSRLDISDILVGRAPQSLSWMAGDRAIAWLDPLLLNYPRTDTLQVYAEAYGVRPGEHYSVQLAFTQVRGGVTRLLGKRAPAISLVEPTTFNGSVGRIRRSVSLAGLDPGDYTLEITVEGQGSKVTAHRRITIAKR